MVRKGGWWGGMEQVGDSRADAGRANGFIGEPVLVVASCPLLSEGRRGRGAHRGGWMQFGQFDDLMKVVEQSSFKVRLAPGGASAGRYTIILACPSANASSKTPLLCRMMAI